VILAKWAGQVTAIASNGQNLTPAIKFVQRLLFHRIQCKGSNAAIIITYNPAVFITPGTASANLARQQGAVVGTYFTLYSH